FFILFFFFQAEDGIRDKLVTGVQTCALPISGRERGRPMRCYVQDISAGSKPRAVTPEGVVGTQVSPDGKFVVAANPANQTSLYRSEERRVGKECRCRWST